LKIAQNNQNPYHQLLFNTFAKQKPCTIAVRI
jgi:hypothetical protein